MPNLLDIRRRIKSVKNTQQITKAMKMVSAAKLKRAQDRVVTARPFANKMTEVLGELAKRTDEDFHHPLLDARGDERYLLVLITADKGLCGAFNTNLIKAAQAFVGDNPDKQIEILAVGRKGRDFFRRRGATIAGNTSALRVRDAWISRKRSKSRATSSSDLPKTPKSTRSSSFTTSSSPCCSSAW